MGLIQAVRDRLGLVWKDLEFIKVRVACAESRLVALEKAVGNKEEDDDGDDDRAEQRATPCSMKRPRESLNSIPALYGEDTATSAPFPPAPGQPDPPTIKKADLDKLIEEHREALAEIERQRLALKTLQARQRVGSMGRGKKSVPTRTRRNN
jgi:hypothetical protein